MTSTELRKKFLEYFESKEHRIVKSAPIVVKDDPTLMFTNAGMNQFKDIFLNNKKAEYPRLANSQKCLRVSGKHNDLEEVGHDTYHHTMFEMLGNWSFGDYFKKEAIDFAWEFLVEVLKIDKTKLYATVFEGDKSDNLEFDSEAYDFWKKYLPESHILKANKKDNFWEMGAQGPCGPCSEIHVDLRDADEIAKLPGSELVNKDHPLVIEIWNLVFMQYNRKANGDLELLPNQHVDTGMGFERLAMTVQGKKSNYDTDIFQTIIKSIEEKTDLKYGEDEKIDIAMRVVSDHVRTIAFSIADGQLPSNNKAGYVIRRILRRAVRYAYTFLNQKDVFLTKLIPALIEVMGDAFEEITKQQTLIEKVIEEEEKSFLKTLETGISLLNKLIQEEKTKNSNTISGKDAFVLFDTYGFPIDLTELILNEQGMSHNCKEYGNEMEMQKSRSRGDAEKSFDDWTVIKEDDREEFVGYDHLSKNVKITRYRKVQQKKETLYQLVFNITPFYAESGGQVGDKGYIEANDEKVSIIDTKNENGVIVHYTKALPQNVNADFQAIVATQKRENTCCNHSATHLLHMSLREVLGSHVEQKGSLVNEKHLRFDFSHFQKLTKEELIQVELKVNALIRQALPLEECRDITIEEAKEQGAMALFGEKYGDLVRTIKFGDSIELCGGTHVSNTGKIGFFKITSESAISAGIRRIEAITGVEAQDFINIKLEALNEIAFKFNNPKKLVDQIDNLIQENKKLEKTIQDFEKKSANELKSKLENNISDINNINCIIEEVNIPNPQVIKDLVFSLKSTANRFIVLASKANGKAMLTVALSDDLVKEKSLHAGTIVRELAKEIKGGGGGQPFFATAGGKDISGLQNALNKAKTLI
jgi:alanyl-tRNA synthetase